MHYRILPIYTSLEARQVGVAWGLTTSKCNPRPLFPHLKRDTTMKERLQGQHVLCHLLYPGEHCLSIRNCLQLSQPACTCIAPCSSAHQVWKLDCVMAMLSHMHKCSGCNDFVVWLVRNWSFETQALSVVAPGGFLGFLEICHDFETQIAQNGP